MDILPTHITEVICINYNKSTALAAQASIFFLNKIIAKIIKQENGIYSNVDA